MSSWKCKHCGLFNSSSIDKCIACFTYNYVKYWQCSECDMVNRQQSFKCSACFNNKRLFKIGDEWIRKYTIPQSLDPQSITISKLIEWNQKLFHIMIRLDNEDKFAISIMQIEDKQPYNSIKTNEESSGKCPRCQSTEHGWCQPVECVEYLWRLHPVSMCINHQNNELYILLQIIKNQNVYSDSSHTFGPKQAMKNIEYYLIVYDLSTQNITQQLSLNVDKILSNDMHSNSRTVIKEMYAIYNDKDDHISSTTTYVINHWVKHLTLPQEVYGMIQQFYTFLCRKNTIQLLLLAETKEPEGEPYDHIRIYRRTLYHGIIDLNNLRFNHTEIDLNITNKKVIEYIDDCKMDQRREPSFLRLRVHHDIFWIFNQWEGTYIVNLDDGTFKKEKYMNPYPNGTDGGFHGEFDKCITNQYDALRLDQDKRYLTILTQDDYNQHSGYCDLVCFDRETKEFMLVQKNASQKLGPIMVFNNHLYLSTKLPNRHIVVYIRKYDCLQC